MGGDRKNLEGLKKSARERGEKRVVKKVGGKDYKVPRMIRVKKSHLLKQKYVLPPLEVHWWPSSPGSALLYQRGINDCLLLLIS